MGTVLFIIGLVLAGAILIGLAFRMGNREGE
jgi:hypothetical protein